MTIGLPHSSQSMSVGIGPVLAAALAATGFSPRIFATMAFALAAPSLSSGTRASTCFSWSPSSLVMLFIPRHLGKFEHPSHGPRLPSRRRRWPVPHLSHWIVVSTGGALGGNILPSLSRLMIVLHSG